MANDLARLRQEETGSVLLETVIVIPLFVLLVGGIMWIGQLNYDKQRLVIADRYLAWNVGNRWNQGFRSGDVAGEVQTKFFPDRKHDEVKALSPTFDTVTSWWWEAYAGVELQVNMPSWTLGWLAAFSIMNRTASLANSVALRGRDVNPGPSGRYEGHLVIMRSTLGENTPYTTRYNNGEPLRPGHYDNDGNLVDPVEDLHIDYKQVFDEP